MSIEQDKKVNEWLNERRRKLLDLTKRNKLINFKLSKTSKAIIFTNECSAKSPQNPFEAKIEPHLPTQNPKRSHFLRF